MTPVESGHVAPLRRTYPEPTGPDTVPVDIVPPTGSSPAPAPSDQAAPPADRAAPLADQAAPLADQDAVAAGAEAPLVAVEPVAVAPPSTATTADPKADSRRALRVARRQRRRLMIGCAVVITVCLALTVAIVVMASDRSTGTPAVTTGDATAAGLASPSLRHSVTSNHTNHTNHTNSATAQKGANP